MPREIFKFFASLKLAVISILTLASVLAWATILESYYGMRSVHVLVYGTPWFAGVLFFLGLNVFCAAASRYPWKRHQIGFVITHTGILTILLGSVLTQKFGVDGNLPVVEGNRNNEVALNDLRLVFYNEAGDKVREIPVPEYGLKKNGRLVEVALTPEDKLVIDEYLPRLVSQRSIVASPVNGIGMPAAQIEFFNSRFRIEEWLVNENPAKPAELNLGPALVSLRKLWRESEETSFLSATAMRAHASRKSSPGYVLIKREGREFRVPIEEALKRWYPLKGARVEVRISQYLPYAVVEKGDLVSRSNDPVNPAVQVEIREPGDSLKRIEKHTIFSNFPEFNTRHGSKNPSVQAIGVDVRMVSLAQQEQEQLAMVGKNRGRLELAIASDGRRLLYRSFGAKGDLKGQGEVLRGQFIATGWMDLQFQVKAWYPAAIQKSVPRYIEYIDGSDSNFLAGIRVRTESTRRPAAQSANPDEGRWLFEGDYQNLPVAGQNWAVQLTKSRLALPFNIVLDKFTIGTDPGTQKAASYQSNVTVQDTSVVTSPRTALISMNEPLQYGGYTFYQASYQMEEGKAPISIFSVNYDPGRPVKYAGSLIMCLGICLMFYMNPHYWDKVLGRKKA